MTVPGKNDLPEAAQGPGRQDACGDAQVVFDLAIAEHLRIFVHLDREKPVLAVVAAKMIETLMAGGKLLFCGNGGSAADAQHLAAELVGRFERHRRGIAALALTTDTSVLTAIANDYGYSEVFGRQVEALGRSGDMLIGLSTSGSSENVCVALRAARRLGISTVVMCGGLGGQAAALADIAVCVPSYRTSRVQEAHIFCGHVLCELVETAMLGQERLALEAREQQGGLPFASAFEKNDSVKPHDVLPHEEWH